MEEEWIWWRREVKGGRRGKGICGWNVIYEKRVKNKKKKLNLKVWDWKNKFFVRCNVNLGIGGLGEWSYFGLYKFMDKFVLSGIIVRSRK